MHETESVLEILVDLDREGIVSLQSGEGSVTMIPFHGEVTGKIFHGIVEPCGVDTQVTNAAGVRHMSARYMLTGEDLEGKPCHIYVENNAWFTGGEDTSSWRSVPAFLTDSQALAPLLQRSGFVGEGRMEEGRLHIRFFRQDR